MSVSRIAVVLLSSYLTCSTPDARAYSGGDMPDQCRAQFGVVVNVDACGKVVLPTLLIESLGTSIHKLRPNDAAYQCRDYRASDQKGHFGKFKQCSFGVLGGTEIFRVGGKKYTVFYDINTVYHVFYEGALTDAQAKHARDLLRKRGLELP